MKTIKYNLILFLLIITNYTMYGQYNGGNSDGSASETLGAISCTSPPSFYSYFGGSGDASSVDILENTTCPFSNNFYAYFGGNNEGSAVETVEAQLCGYPPQFYAFFGGENDGHSLDFTAPICPTAPPVADFTASATSVCVGQSVTFTDTSTNIPSAWTWTLPGATPNSSIVQNPTVVYSTPGTYTVTLKAANYNGNNTKIVTSMITVTAYPTITGTTPAGRCNPGTVVLGATASTGTLSWYAAATGGTALGTGTSFTTPTISTTTTYYVETLNAVCSSARTAVIATVTPSPTITSSTPASRCDIGTVTLNATSSAGNTIWYAAATGGSALATTNNFVTPSISTTTTYYVEATTGSCSSTRTAVFATVNTTPIITSTTPANRCDSGTVTLTAVANSGTVNWYANASGGTSLATGGSFITPSLTATTTYYVEASNATCISSRTAVTATINATPTVTGNANNRCDAGTVVLSASATAGTLSWYAAASGGSALGTGTSFTTPSISTTTTYYVESVNGTCTSTRIAVIATINTSPTITATTPTTICGGETFTISATASAGTLAWYNVATGGIVQGNGNSFSLSNWGTTTTFYVQATNGSCQSARIPVIVTVNDRPFNTTLTPATRCGTGTVTLGATYTIGTANWYNVASGGTSLATGPTFTTPVISTTTTYYVEAVNNGCVSAIRTAITATVNQQPTITSTTPATRCGNGSVVLSATSSAGNLVWYAAATGGTALATTSSFTTPVLSATTSYFVEAVNGTCATASRTEVIATINTLPSITSTTPASRCGSGTVTLSATASSGTINWFANSTGGTSLATGGTFTTPTIATSTTYYVEVSNGTCTSVRTAVLATVNTAPTITSTTPATRCGSGSVTLSATASSGTLNWFATATGGTALATTSSFTTPVLSVTTSYFVEATNGTCGTSTRSEVIATINSAPIISVTNSAARCGSGSVLLSANYSSGIVNWFDAPTGGNLVFTGNNFATPVLTVTTIYYVEGQNSSCNSAIRTAITATINAIPTITSTTPAGSCGSGSVTLTATASSGTINWFANATGGTSLATGGSYTTPNLTTSTTYYVEASNGTCISTRFPILASVNSTPGIMATGSDSRCDAGTLTLSAAADFGTVSWFANATGGTALATGATFTTPVISVTTIYYAEVSSGTCTSSRVAVTASINPISAPTGNVNQSFCAGETVGLLVTTFGTNIVWYSAATGGTVISNGTLLVSGTTYYASQNNGTCESPTRLAVTATLGSCLGSTEFVFNQIKLWPNPVTDFVTITNTEMMTRVIVSDMLGRILSNKEVNDIETKVDMLNYPTGTYLVQVSIDNATKTFKVIKR